MGTAASASFELEFYEDESGNGEHLGANLFEFRLRMVGSQVVDDDDAGRKEGASEKILLRVFCHAYGDRVVLLLAGYDKGEDPSKRRQQKEITLARKRLEEHKKRLSEAAKGSRR